MVSMSAVWDRTTEFLSDKMASVMPVALATIFVPTSIQGAIQPLAGSGTPASALLFSLTTMVLALVSLWGRLAVVTMALNPALTAREAPMIALRRLPATMGTMIVVLVGLLLLWLPVWGLLTASGFNLTAAGTVRQTPIPPATGWWLALAVLVLLPVTFWLFARLLTILPPVIVAERRAIGAIGRAWSLTRGAALRIVGVILLYLVVASVAVLAARTVFGSVLRLVTSDDGTVSIAMVLTSIIVGAVGTAFSVIGAAFTAKLYLALRDRAAPQ